MKDKKRAIIFDMDETLEYGIASDTKDSPTMVLRPNLDKLIAKLKEAKKEGINIVLCTEAQETWVERFLTLKPEFRTLFDKMLTRNNEDDWKYYDEETNPIEYAAKQKDSNLANGKPITTFGYDSILFIDDNKQEANRLKRLFEIAPDRWQKDVTYFSGFKFCEGDIGLLDIFKYKKFASQSPEFSQKLEQYLTVERNNPGCHMMCSAIDAFMRKDFIPGLTLIDEVYSVEYDTFYKQRFSLDDELQDFACNLAEEIGEELYTYSASELDELKQYLSTDKSYPYEGIETRQPEKSKREKLNKLIQTARDTKNTLDHAQKLRDSYQHLEPKTTEL